MKARFPIALVLILLALLLTRQAARAGPTASLSYAGNSVDFSLGQLILGSGIASCGAATTGAIRYNSATPRLEFCNGSSWQTVTGSATPAGSNGQIQFNSNGSALGASSSLFWDDTNKRLGIGGAPSTPFYVTFKNTLTTGATTAINFMSLSPSADQATTVSNIGLYGETQILNTSTHAVGKVMAADGYAENDGTGAVAELDGSEGGSYNTANAAINTLRGGWFWSESDLGTVTGLYGAHLWTGVYGGTVTGQYGLMIDMDHSGGTLSNRYGLYLGVPGGTAVTDDYGIYQEGTQKNYFGGKIGINRTIPQATLDVNGYMRLAKYSAQPVACSATNDGAIALTHVYTLCVCKGGSTVWVNASDGSTACSW